MMAQFEQFFDALFAAIASVLMSLIRRLAKFAVAIPPAWYWGTIIYESSGRLEVGIAAAIVLEIGGMMAAYYAVAYWGTVKGKMSAGLTVIYLIIGIGVMWQVDSATDDEKLIITAVFAIAGMVYVLSAMAELEQKEATANQTTEAERLAKEEAAEAAQKERDEADRKRQQVIEDRQIEHQERMDAAKLKLAHEEKMARIAAKAKRASTEPAQSKLEPAPASYECEDCGRSFATVQALNAHGRFCPARVPANGAVKQ